MALPLAIAFGIASGVSPEKGIITAIVAGLLISVFGGSKVQIGGPTGAFIVIVAGIINQYGIQGLTIATLMAGFFLIGFGLLRLGTIIKYIPYPIIVGFTSGIAVTIFTTQIKDLLGMQITDVPSDFVEKWMVYFQHIRSIDVWSTLVGLASVVIIALIPKYSKRIPGSLVAIVVMTVVALLLKQYAGVNSIETIGDRFSINSQLPGAVVPVLSWETIKELVAPAMTIAVLGAIESLLSATVADGVIGDHHNSNTELIISVVRGNPCNWSHCPYDDEYQQWWSYTCCGNHTRGCVVAYLLVPDAFGSVYPDGMSGRCVGRCKLWYERLAFFPRSHAQSKE